MASPSDYICNINKESKLSTIETSDTSRNPGTNAANGIENPTESQLRFQEHPFGQGIPQQGEKAQDSHHVLSQVVQGHFQLATAFLHDGQHLPQANIVLTRLASRQITVSRKPIISPSTQRDLIRKLSTFALWLGPYYPYGPTLSSLPRDSCVVKIDSQQW